MTVWEFQACMDGYSAANGTEQPLPIPDDETVASWGVEGF